MKCVVCARNPVPAPQDTCEECRKHIHRRERYEAESWDYERAQARHERQMGRG